MEQRSAVGLTACGGGSQEEVISESTTEEYISKYDSEFYAGTVLALSAVPTLFKGDDDD